MNTVDMLILVCIESSLCLVAFFGFFGFLIKDSGFFLMPNNTYRVYLSFIVFLIILSN